MKAVLALGLLVTLSVLAAWVHPAWSEPGVRQGTELATDEAGATTTASEGASETRDEKVDGGVPAVQAIPPEIEVSLGQLQNLAVVAIGIGSVGVLLVVLVLLQGRRLRGLLRASAEGDGKDVPPLPSAPSPQSGRGAAGAASVLPTAATTGRGDPPAGRNPLPVGSSKGRPPTGRQVPVQTSDEFQGLPHADAGRALRRLHQALPNLARKISDPRQRERFLAELDLPIQARVKRFKEATSRGDAYLKEHWVEQDLVTTLNSLAHMLSSVIGERYRGRRGNRELEEELSGWLYEQLAPICKAEGWFGVESILPFTTRFDPKIHFSLGSVELAGSGNLIVSIKAIGRRDARRGFVTHKAEVLVGR